MNFDLQRKLALLAKQAKATAQLPATAGKPIAEGVYDYFQQTGFVAVPEGEFAAAVSYRQSSDLSDPRRSLHLIFADGSDVGIHYGEVSGFSQAGDTEVEQRFAAALKIAPELATADHASILGISAAPLEKPTDQQQSKIPFGWVVNSPKELEPIEAFTRDAKSAEKYRAAGWEVTEVIAANVSDL